MKGGEILPWIDPRGYRGVIAAYGYRTAPRLRFDYLSPDAKGAATVDVVDTLWLDSEVPDLVALAFSADSRRIACLASSRAIDVVPVP